MAYFLSQVYDRVVGRLLWRPARQRRVQSELDLAATQNYNWKSQRPRRVESRETGNASG